MIEFLFEILKLLYKLSKMLICKLIYINHNYIVIKTEKPFYIHEITGSGQGEYVTEGIVVYATIQCKFCNKRKRINLFNDVIPIKDIPKIKLETSYPNDLRTRFIVTFQKYRRGIYRLDIPDNYEETLEFMLEKYRCVKYAKINGEYILLLADWGDKQNDFRTI